MIRIIIIMIIMMKDQFVKNKKILIIIKINQIIWVMQMKGQYQVKDNMK